MKKRLYMFLFLILLNGANSIYATDLKNSDSGMQAAAANDNAGHDDFRFNYVMAVSTNPFNFIWKQFPLAIEYITPNVAHEVRLNYFGNSPKMIYDYDRNNFKTIKSWGIEMSYTFKWFVRRAGLNNHMHPYHAVQVRYSYRTWAPYESDVVKKSETASFVTEIHSHSTYYDLCYIYGRQFRYKTLFLDAYAGAGIGYRTLLANYDYSRYNILESPFIAKNWNTVYPAIRLGIRIGLFD